MSTTLTTYSNLNRHILTTGDALPYRLWLLARSLDVDGRGVVHVNAIGRLLDIHGLTHVKPLILRNKLSPFLHRNGDSVYYASLSKILQWYDVPAGRQVAIPISAVESAQRWKAYLYASYFSLDAVRMTRATIAKLFGISKQTQRRYERAIGMDVTPNWVIAEGYTEQEAEGLPVARNEQDEAVYWQNDGDIAWQTANTYQYQLPTRCPRWLRRLNKQMRAGADYGGSANKRIYYGKLRGRLVQRDCLVLTPWWATGPNEDTCRVWHYSEFAPSKKL